MAALREDAIAAHIREITEDLAERSAFTLDVDLAAAIELAVVVGLTVSAGHQLAAGRELVVVRNRARALQAGFDEQGRHPTNSAIRAWWPDRGWQDLMGPPIRRVTIGSDVPDRTSEGSLREILRKRQSVFGTAAIWMEIGW